MAKARVGLYTLQGETLTRTHHACPKCGAGTYLAEHYDRRSCGRCGYMETKLPSERTGAKPKTTPRAEKPKAAPAEKAKPAAVEKPKPASGEKGKPAAPEPAAGKGKPGAAPAPTDKAEKPKAGGKPGGKGSG